MAIKFDSLASTCVAAGFVRAHEPCGSSPDVEQTCFSCRKRIINVWWKDFSDPSEWVLDGPIFMWVTKTTIVEWP